MSEWVVKQTLSSYLNAAILLPHSLLAFILSSRPQYALGKLISMLLIIGRQCMVVITHLPKLCKWILQPSPSFGLFRLPLLLLLPIVVARAGFRRGAQAMIDANETPRWIKVKTSKRWSSSSSAACCNMTFKMLEVRVRAHHKWSELKLRRYLGKQRMQEAN